MVLHIMCSMLYISDREYVVLGFSRRYRLWRSRLVTVYNFIVLIESSRSLFLPLVYLFEGTIVRCHFRRLRPFTHDRILNDSLVCVSSTKFLPFLNDYWHADGEFQAFNKPRLIPLFKMAFIISRYDSPQYEFLIIWEVMVIRCKWGK